MAKPNIVLAIVLVASRSRRERSVLAFLVQDGDSRALCYANATVRKDQAAQEILAFVDFWQDTTGALPPHLVFDSQLTTYAVLDRLDRRGIRFITLRRRGPAVLRQLSALPHSQWTSMKLTGVHFLLCFHVLKVNSLTWGKISLNLWHRILV